MVDFTRGRHDQPCVIGDPPGEGSPITGTRAEWRGWGLCHHGHSHLPEVTPTSATSASCGAALASGSLSLNLPNVA